MTRPLVRIDGSQPSVVLAALRAALTGDGPAVFPTAETASAVPAPAEVQKAVALVVETSGSTGAPKRVAITTDALLASAAGSAAALGGAGQWLLALPAHYIAGAQVLVRSIAAETEPVLLGPGHFDPVGFARAAESLDADLRFTSLVPAQLGRIVDAAATDAGVLAAARRFTRILVGGQATPPAVLQRAAELGIAVTRTYGSSETSGGCVYDGVPIGATRIAIRDGAVELSGPSLALGYLDDEERTAAVFVEHDGRRWYRTGDVGEIDADGRLRVLGRADDVIISGGVKVPLGAVERRVRTMPGLEDAVVVAVAHPLWGEAPAVAVSGTRPHPSLEEVRGHVGAELGSAARPALLEVFDLPTLASGKPDRRAIAARMQDQARHGDG
ncbi:MAG: AMP-binding protein [Leifsonia sp.]